MRWKRPAEEGFVAWSWKRPPAVVCRLVSTVVPFLSVRHFRSRRGIRFSCKQPIVMVQACLMPHNGRDVKWWLRGLPVFLFRQSRVLTCEEPRAVANCRASCERRLRDPARGIHFGNTAPGYS